MSEIFLNPSQYRIICAQLGARDHYAFPRAFHKAGLLDLLVTDFWSSHLPWPRKLQPGRIRGRHHEDLSKAAVCSPNARTLAVELWFRLFGVRGWERIISGNSFFQTTALRAIPWDRFRKTGAPKVDSGIQQPVLFAYSYAALELLACAKSRGWITILGQINSGPVEVQVVAAEAKRWPDFRPTRGEAPKQYWENWRKEIALADHVVVNSQWSKSALLKAGVLEHKLRVIPVPFEETEVSGFPPKDYPDQFNPARPLRALFLGQINHRKGVPALLAALDMLADLPIELWMVGAEELSIPRCYREHPRIRWHGNVPRCAVNGFYQRADVFLFPTHSDGFGLTQLEAQARRVPVVASKNCGRVVVDGKNGILLESATPVAIANALTYCCKHPQQLAAWSQASGVDAAFSLSSAGASVLAMLTGK